MNEYDEKVRRITTEINQKKQQKSWKIHDKTDMQEKWNSFLKGKDIKKLDSEIAILTWDIDTLSTELKKQENHTKNIRIVSQRHGSKKIIHLDTKEKTVFIQWCKGLFHAIE